MIYFLPNLLSNSECKNLLEIFEIEKKIIPSSDVSVIYSGTKNSYGFKPSSNYFNLYLDKLKPNILAFDSTITKLLNVNTYVREYSNKSFLEKHTDRKDISITMSICLESTIKNTWPLNATIDNKDYSYSTKVGDGILLFNADKVTHWRDELDCIDDERVVQFFLHWKPDFNKQKNQKTII
jgi:hypothetical protein